MSLTPQALRLLSRELGTLRGDPPEGVRVVVDEEDLTCLEGWVQGPVGTPYEGGYFKVRFNFTTDYPNLPPKCTMMTKIFHPNVSKSGEICVDTLKKGWKKEYGVGHVLVTIKCLLIYPNPESALDEEAGKQLLADYEGYCKYARLMTSIHATPKVPPSAFSSPASASASLASRPSPLPLALSAGSSPALPEPKGTTASGLSSSKTSPSPSSAHVLGAPAAPGSGSAKPTPLGQHLQQEQSPVLPSDAGAGGGGGIVGEKAVLKAINVPPAGGAGPKGAGGGGKVKTAAGAAAGGAKRGLKRL